MVAILPIVILKEFLRLPDIGMHQCPFYRIKMVNAINVPLNRALAAFSKFFYMGALFLFHFTYLIISTVII